MTTMLNGLVRVVARDGSVWWTRPENVQSVIERESVVIPDRTVDDNYNVLYWGSRTKKGKK